MKLSARNVLSATVKAVTPGAVDTEVIVEVARPGRLTDRDRTAPGPRCPEQGGCSDQYGQCISAIGIIQGVAILAKPASTARFTSSVS